MANAMKSIFAPQTTMPKARETLPDPKVIRQPTKVDPSIQGAVTRSRLAAQQRGGRASTIMADMGANGTTMGAGVV